MGYSQWGSKELDRTEHTVYCDWEHSREHPQESSVTLQVIRLD